MSTQFVSASKLIGDCLCPRKNKEDKFKTSPATLFGDAVHAGMADLARGRDPIPAYVAAALKNKVPASEQKRAEEIFARFRDLRKVTIDQNQIVSVETDDFDKSRDAEFYGKRFFQSEIVPGVWGLRGSMDLVDFIEDENGIIFRVWDWKTGFGEPADDLQLACYALVVWDRYLGKTRDPFRIRTGFYYLEKDTYDQSEWDNQSLIGALEYVDTVARRFLARKEFPETPNKYCGYCSLKGSCKAYSQQLQAAPEKSAFEIEEKADNLPQIIESIEKLEAIEKAAAAIAKDLKDKRARILTANGPTVVNGRTWSAKEQVSTYRYDVGPIFTGIQAIIGRPPFEILELNCGAIDDLAKGLDKEQAKSVRKFKTAHREPKSSHIVCRPQVARELPESETVADLKADGALTHYVCSKCGAITSSFSEVLSCRHCTMPDSSLTVLSSLDAAKELALNTRKQIEGVTQ